MKRMRWI